MKKQKSFTIYNLKKLEEKWNKMSKNLNNIYEVKSLDSVYPTKLKELLNSGKTLIIPLDKGINVEKSLKKGYSNFLQANIELKEEKETDALCWCGKKNKYFNLCLKIKKTNISPFLIYFLFLNTNIINFFKIINFNNLFFWS